jgi:hypothetical protein
MGPELHYGVNAVALPVKGVASAVTKYDEPDAFMAIRRRSLIT